MCDKPIRYKATEFTSKQQMHLTRERQREIENLILVLTIDEDIFLHSFLTEMLRNMLGDEA